MGGGIHPPTSWLAREMLDLVKGETAYIEKVIKPMVI